MDRHLVAVEVGVEGVADERVELNGLAVDEDGLEGLDAQPVQCRRAVEHYGMVLDDFLEGVPDFAAQPIDHPLGGLDVSGISPSPPAASSRTA